MHECIERGVAGDCLDVEAVDVCNGVDRYSAQAEIFACPYHAYCNLATVGNEHFRKFGRDNMQAALWPPRAPLRLKNAPGETTGASKKAVGGTDPRLGKSPDG